MLIKVLATGYYAQQDLKTPVRIGIKAMVANMFLNVLLVLPLYFWWNIGHVGLALATSLAAYLNAGLLLSGLLKARTLRWQSGFAMTVFRIATATVAMTAVLLLFKGDGALWAALSGGERVMRALLLTAGGMAVYGLVLFALGARVAQFRQSEH
jgi:putative peptidoglycan lipid II flippase